MFRGVTAGMGAGRLLPSDTGASPSIAAVVAVLALAMLSAMTLALPAVRAADEVVGLSKQPAYRLGL